MLLATDLDGTFLGGDPKDRLSLYQTIAAHPEIRLAYVTGRSLESVLPLLADPTLPQPDFIISDVGASLVHGDTCSRFSRCKAQSMPYGPATARWPAPSSALPWNVRTYRKCAAAPTSAALKKPPTRNC